MLAPGDRVPDFRLPGSDGRDHVPADHAGARWVIFFYPKDSTPGCTREACDFTSSLAAFERLKVPVFGDSGGTVDSKRKFAASEKITFPLLADEDHVVARAFGAWGKKKNYGREYEGIVRSTFLVGADGRIERVWPNVKVDGHVAEVLETVRAG